MSEQRINHTGTGSDLLDFMFTIAISIGLIPELLQQGHLQGILSQSWIKNNTPPSGNELFDLTVLFLALLVLTFSWVGYKTSVQFRPIKLETLRGMVRFLLDIILVILYAFMFIQFRHLTQVIFVLTVIFLLYFVWDLVKVSEYWGRYKTAAWKSKLREVLWLPCIPVSYILMIFASNGYVDRWVVALLAFLLVVAPRAFKVKLPRA